MSEPKLFYFCYDHQQPNGGQKDTYQHVDVLNRSGYQAYVVHSNPDFRLQWFENNTRVVGAKHFTTIYDPKRDFMVFPEDLAMNTVRVPGKKVIFNKNIYRGFSMLATQHMPDPCLSRDVVAIFTVSRHNQDQLRFAYPGKKVILVDYDLNLDAFSYANLKSKRAAVVSLRKRPDHLHTLMQVLDARVQAGCSRARNTNWIFIENMSEKQVADLLRDCLIFVFLSIEEGLPRMPLEAMACGCLVAAYNAPPLNEYLLPEYAFRQGEFAEMAKFIETVLSLHPSQREPYEELTRKARSIAELYSSERQRETVVRAWEDVLSV